MLREAGSAFDYKRYLHPPAGDLAAIKAEAVTLLRLHQAAGLLNPAAPADLPLSVETYWHLFCDKTAATPLTEHEKADLFCWVMRCAYLPKLAVKGVSESAGVGSTIPADTTSILSQVLTDLSKHMETLVSKLGGLAPGKDRGVLWCGMDEGLVAGRERGLVPVNQTPSGRVMEAVFADLDNGRLLDWHNSHCFLWQVVSILYAEKLEGDVSVYADKLHMSSIAWQTEIAILQRALAAGVVTAIKWQELKPVVRTRVFLLRKEIAVLEQKIKQYVVEGKGADSLDMQSVQRLKQDKLKALLGLTKNSDNWCRERLEDRHVYTHSFGARPSAVRVSSLKRWLKQARAKLRLKKFARRWKMRTELADRADCRTPDSMVSSVDLSPSSSEIEASNSPPRLSDRCFWSCDALARPTQSVVDDGVSKLGPRG